MEAGRKEPRKRLLEDLRKDSRLTYPNLKEAVRALGSLPDHVNALDWFSQWLKEARAELNRS
jgi:poly-gamma-glutamate capsule biosynthesis protein CapA/YwtB (metallophosphatase superfamily)